MKKRRNTIAVAVVAVLIYVSGGLWASAAPQQQESEPQKKTAKDYLEKGGHKGKVIETMDAGTYTYIQFEEKGKKLWVAAPKMKVKVGDTIAFAGGLPMKNFASRTLKRTFETILFVNTVVAIDENAKTADPHAGAAGFPQGHPNVGQGQKPAPRKVVVKPGSVQRAADGVTVAECFSRKDKLKDREVTVRGRVVKFTANIMGKNWIHIQDGTGKEGSNDLTVTTKVAAKIGDLVIVSGKLLVDKDFGAGYRYPVIIEDAKVIVE